MLQPLLTGQQAKEARTALGLSQGAVATAAAINRSYLSQFENGRYLPTDAILRQLRELFAGRGYEFPEPVELEPERAGPGTNPYNGCRIMDNFVVAPLFDGDEADEMLSEYSENTRKVEGVLRLPVRRGFFGINDEDLEAKTREALLLMARNFVIIQSLHGEGASVPEAEKEVETVGGHLARLLGLEFETSA